MQTELDLLLPVARADDALADLRERISRAEAKVAAAAAVAAEREQRVAAIEVEHMGLRREERKHQEALRKAEGLRKQANDALAAGLGDAAAAERQIERCSEIIDQSETAILEILGQRDDLDREALAVAAELAEARATHARVVGETAPQLQSWRNEAAAREAVRGRALEGVPDHLVQVYTELRRSRGRAFARIERESCSACSWVVPVQRRLDLRSGRVLPCDGCGRWLVDATKWEAAASEEAAGSRRP